MKKQVLYILFLFLSLSAAAQQLTLTGVVTSADDGEPLFGATVQVMENPSNIVSTDLDGNYTININKGQRLRVSYIGCTAFEQRVEQGGTLDVALENSNILEEVVAIGYGTVKKSDLTGAVTTISGDKLQSTPSASLANALQGQAAGVTVNSLSGRPGANAEVRIRGVGTVNNASPIYVVDGVITDDISFLSPNDIASTEILKDASATAIYGSRGANGVIIVSTKSGSVQSRTKITLDAYVGVQSRWKKLDVMGAKQFADTYVAINGNNSMKKYYAEKGFNDWLKLYMGVGASDYYPTMYNAETNPTGINYADIDTDWQDEVFRNGMIQNYHLSIDGGNDKFTYAMSGSWFKQEGTVIGSDYSRFTARLNTSYKATPWLKVGENISFMSSVAKNSFGEGDNNPSAGASILSAAFAMAPWDPTHYPEGSVNRKGRDLSGAIAAGSNFKNVINPFSMVEYSHPKDRVERWVGNVFAEITPIEHLVFRSSFSFDYKWNINKSFRDKYQVSAFDKMDKNFLTSSLYRTYNWNVDNILTYSRSIGRHDFSIMAGQTVEEFNYYGMGNSGANILNPVPNNWFLSQVTEDFGRPGDTIGRSRRFSWLGRLTYSYANKYLATVNFRADGSSKFPENAWGYFPSFSLAWRLSGEKFLSDNSNVSELKLRFGWGKVGNDQIGNDAFTLTMANAGPSFLDYVLGVNQQYANGATVLTWINKGGRWEATEQWSLGVDFGFWNNRLTGSVEGFIRNTKDMLMTVNAPAHVANRFPGSANVGQVRNIGFELQLEHRNAVSRDFEYSIGGNFSFIKNKLTKLNGGSPIYTNYSQVQVVDQGYPLYYFWGFEYEGVYKTDQEALDYLHGYTELTTPYHAGDAKYRDVNGDGIINNDDRVNLGSSIPTINYGINLGAYYKAFDLQIFFQGIAGSKIYNQQRHRLEGNGSESVIVPEMVNAWTVDNPDGSIPNPKNSINYQVSSRFLESGSYLRLKNLQFGWTLPLKWIAPAGFTNCRFYIQGSNLLTVTGYKGFDPEVSGGVDYGNYPQSRSFLFGVNITY